MNNSDVKIGMKVVPFQKTIGDVFEKSIVWKWAQRDKQPFLYVNGYEPYNDYWRLHNSETGEQNGDFYKAEDFEPYVSEEELIDAVFSCWIRSYYYTFYANCFRYNDFDPMPRRQFKDMQGNIHFYDECISIKDTDKYLDDVLSRRDLVGVGTIYKINGVVQQPVDEKNPNLCLFFVDKGRGF